MSWIISLTYCSKWNHTNGLNLVGIYICRYVRTYKHNFSGGSCSGVPSILPPKRGRTKKITLSVCVLVKEGEYTHKMRTRKMMRALQSREKSVRSQTWRRKTWKRLRVTLSLWGGGFTSHTQEKDKELFCLLFDKVCWNLSSFCL